MFLEGSEHFEDECRSDGPSTWKTDKHFSVKMLPK